MDSLTVFSPSDLNTLRTLESLDRLLGEVDLLQQRQRAAARRQTELLATCHEIGGDARRLGGLQKRGRGAARELLSSLTEAGGQLRAARGHLLSLGESLSVVAHDLELLGQRKPLRILVLKEPQHPAQAAHKAVGSALGIEGPDRRCIGNEHAARSATRRATNGTWPRQRGSAAAAERVARSLATPSHEAATPPHVARAVRTDSITEEERAEAARPDGACDCATAPVPPPRGVVRDLGAAPGEAVSSGRAGEFGANAIMMEEQWPAVTGADAVPQLLMSPAEEAHGRAPPGTAVSRFSENIARTVTEQGKAIAHSILNARYPPAVGAESSCAGNDGSGGGGGEDGGSRPASGGSAEHSRPPRKSAGARSARLKRPRRAAAPTGAPVSPTGFKIAHMEPCVCAKAEQHLKVGHEICDEIARALEQYERPAAAASAPLGAAAVAAGSDAVTPEGSAMASGDHGPAGSGDDGSGVRSSERERGLAEWSGEKAADVRGSRGSLSQEEGEERMEETKVTIHRTLPAQTRPLWPTENGSSAPRGSLPGGTPAALEAISRAARLSDLCSDLAKQLGHQQHQQHQQQWQQQQGNVPEPATGATPESPEGLGRSSPGAATGWDRQGAAVVTPASCRAGDALAKERQAGGVGWRPPPHGAARATTQGATSKRQRGGGGGGGTAAEEGRRGDACPAVKKTKNAGGKIGSEAGGPVPRRRQVEGFTERVRSAGLISGDRPLHIDDEL